MSVIEENNDANERPYTEIEEWSRMVIEEVLAPSESTFGLNRRSEAQGDYSSWTIRNLAAYILLTGEFKETQVPHLDLVGVTTLFGESKKLLLCDFTTKGVEYWMFHSVEDTLQYLQGVGVNPDPIINYEDMFINEGFDDPHFQNTVLAISCAFSSTTAAMNYVLGRPIEDFDASLDPYLNNIDIDCSDNSSSETLVEPFSD